MRGIFLKKFWGKKLDSKEEDPVNKILTEWEEKVEKEKDLYLTENLLLLHKRGEELLSYYENTKNRYNGLNATILTAYFIASPLILSKIINFNHVMISFYVAIILFANMYIAYNWFMSTKRRGYIPCGGDPISYFRDDFLREESGYKAMLMYNIIAIQRAINSNSDIVYERGKYMTRAMYGIATITILLPMSYIILKAFFS